MKSTKDCMNDTRSRVSSSNLFDLSTPSRITKYKLNKATYDVIKNAIRKRQDITDLISQVKDEDLLTYNAFDHRTLAFHCVDTCNPDALAKVLIEIFHRVEFDFAETQEILNYGMKPPTGIKTKGGFSPLMKSLQQLKKDNDIIKNKNAFNYSQCILLQIMAGVDVDCNALIEPKKESTNARDYQMIHPLSLAFTYVSCLFVFIVLCLFSFLFSLLVVWYLYF